jgi:hypothetical protein
MSRQRLNLIITVGTTLCLLVGSSFGKTLVVHRSPGRGHVFTRPLRPGISVRPHVRRPPFAMRPYGRRSLFHRISPNWLHRHKVIVVRTHYGRRIKAFPGHGVTSRFGVVQRIIVTAWFRNSNGSLTAVELVKRGLGYVGPRGEWYQEMPTKRQLWIAYGF